MFDGLSPQGIEEVEAVRESPRRQRLRARARSAYHRAQLAASIEGGAEALEAANGQTVAQWAEAIRPGIPPLVKRSTDMREALEGRAKSSEAGDKLSSPIARDCIRLLRTFERLATTKNVPDRRRAAAPDMTENPQGDPIAIARMLDRQDLNLTLETIEKGMATLPDTERQTYEQVIAFFRNDVRALFAQSGMHPAVNVVDRRSLNRNTRLRKTTGQGLQMAVTGIAGLGGLISAFIALKGNGDFTTAGLYLGTAAAAANWGDLTGTGAERLDRQLGWLIRGQSPLDRNGRQRIQGLSDLKALGYNIHGESWRQFTEKLYSDGRKIFGNKIHFGQQFTSVDPTDPNAPRSEVTRIVALAPADIRDDVRKMLQSRDDGRTGAETGINGVHFRAYFSLISRARTPETRAHVLRFIKDGTSAPPLVM